jgi:hypothetical protein
MIYHNFDMYIYSSKILIEFKENKEKLLIRIKKERVFQ